MNIKLKMKKPRFFGEGEEERSMGVIQVLEHCLVQSRNQICTFIKKINLSLLEGPGMSLYRGKVHYCLRSCQSTLSLVDGEDNYF